MKLIAALALMFSVQAFACPTLDGAFTCKLPDGTQQPLSFTQQTNNGVTTYLYNGSAMPADNKVYPVQDDANVKSATFRAWCDDDVTLKGELKGKFYNQGALFGDVTLSMTWAMAGNDIQQVTNGNVVNTGGTYPIANTLTCTRNP